MVAEWGSRKKQIDSENIASWRHCERVRQRCRSASSAANS